MSNNAPVDYVFSNGIKVSKWQNTSQDGRAYNTFSLQKSYKDQNNQWQTSTSYNLSDLAIISALCQTMLTKSVSSASVPTAQTQTTAQNGYAQPAAAVYPPVQQAAGSAPLPPLDEPAPF